MVSHKITIKEALKCHPLAPAVLRQLGGGKDAVTSAIDAANNGADGGFPGFTTYQENLIFVNKNRKAIAALAERDAEDMGMGTFNMIKGFNWVTTYITHHS